MTLQEAAYNILNLLSGGRSTDNEFRSVEQIKFQVLYYRALFGRREMQKGGRTEEFEQTISGLPVISPPLASLQLPNYVGTLHWTVELPAYLRLADRSGLVSVSDTETGEEIPVSERHRVAALSWSRYTGQARRAFEDGQRIAVTNHPVGNRLTVRAVFEDVRKAHDAEVVLRGRTDFWDDDTTQIPLPADVYAQIVDVLTKNEGAMITKTMPDMLANQAPDGTP